MSCVHNVLAPVVELGAQIGNLQGVPIRLTDGTKVPFVIDSCGALSCRSPLALFALMGGNLFFYTIHF
tara:strand:- start:180 stop:383 length:204 start_codon:yes stop_codon:yes gene_type:complete